ncbi:N-acetyltransferase family protein [Streptococcus sp.]
MLKIRSVTLKDAPELVRIYAPYVEKTAISFEYQIPTIEEFEGRIEKILQRFPYLVAEEDGHILAYAYASTYYDRSAYDWAVEVSVYVDQNHFGMGLGSRLYEALEMELEARGYLRFLACIALPNPASIALHEKQGYVKVAHFPKIGYKFDQWHDIFWMQKIIEGPVKPLM